MPSFSNGQAVSLVIGESSFTASTAPTTSTGLSLPTGLTFGLDHDLWVSDFLNYRVLAYSPPFSAGEAATIVIGQSSFTASDTTATSTGLSGPQGLAFDSSGNLWVSDEANNRVLEYKAPVSTGEAASLVIGQSSFTTSAAATTSTGLNNPIGLAFDSSGNLWVADSANSRVLQYGGPGSASSSTTTTRSTTATTSTTTPPSTTATTSASTTGQSSTTAQTSSSSTAGGGGVPEFPYQILIATLFTVLLAASYLLVRRHTTPRGHLGQEAPDGRPS
jgi:hypothetical protein